MASPRSRRTVRSLGVFLATVGLFWFGTGLLPIPELTWLAPLPMLLLAPRESARRTSVLAFLGYGLGSLNMAAYYADHLQLPIPLLVLVLVLMPAVFALVVLLFRGLVRRGRILVAVLAVPVTWVCVEYVVCTCAGAGENWTLATTQASVVPVLQLAPATGIWGITFLVMWVPSVIAGLCAPGASRPRIAAVGLVVVLVAVGYGVLRLNTADSPRSVRVALLTARQSTVEIPVTSPAATAMVQDYLTALRSLPAGTRIAVLPEYGFRAQDTDVPRFVQPFAAIAAQRHLDVVLGAAVYYPGGTSYDSAIDLPADGGAPLIYHKQSRVPGAEDERSIGRADTFLPGFGGQVGLDICADNGHPEITRTYARAGARLMIVPALDFDVDGWLQSRVQLTRGVESGFSMARDGLDGELTISDQHGRLVAERLYDPAVPVTVLSADLPLGTGDTLYTAWGDWFAWLCGALAIACLAALPRRRRTPTSADRPPMILPASPPTPCDLP